MNKIDIEIMVFSGYMPSSGIVGSYGSSVPSFLRNLHGGQTNLHFHQQCQMGMEMREGTYVYLWLTQVWQKPTLYWKAIILQLKKSKNK